MPQEQSVLPEAPAPAPAPAASKADDMHVPPQAEASSEEPQTPLPSTSAPLSKVAALCGVCEAFQSKYKCPRCYLPYCSVACNKLHKENHPPDEPKPPFEPEMPGPSSNDTTSSHPYDPSNPFRALDTSDKLQHLFRKYPSLAEQLLAIYAATQPPEEAPDKRIPASLMQGVAKKDNWNRDIGIKNGKEALRKARRAEGKAGDAIREYSELILHLINTQDEKGSAATTILREQMAQEDSKLIEQLMAQERR